MPTDKKTRGSQSRHFPRVGPITSREELVNTPHKINVRTVLNVQLNAERNRMKKSIKRVAQLTAALNALLKETK